MTQAIYSLSVLSKPFTVPSQIEADISVLIDLESNIKRGDLVLPDGVELVGDPDISVAWIQPPRVQEETTVVEGAEEGAEAGADEGADEGDDSEETNASES